MTELGTLSRKGFREGKVVDGFGPGPAVGEQGGRGMDSRRVMRAVRVLVGFLLLAGGGGCSYLPYALPDIGSALANPVHDFWFRHRLDVAADEAWRKVVAHCGGRTLSSGYAEGFHNGYVDYVEGGGNGKPPTTPPYCMRCDVLRSPDRQQLIVDYYAGYKQGADVAKFERLRDLVIVPLGRQPQPTSPGFTVTAVTKDDPRQPDPFAPQAPLPPGFRTSPGDAAYTPSSVAPQPQELPIPRKAPAVLDKAPDAPAVTPMPTVPAVPPPAVTPKIVPPDPAPLDPKKLPVLRPEPEAEAPMPDPQSRLRSSQSSLGSGSPRPLAVAPPPYVPVPIQPPPTVVPVMAIPGEEAEPPTPRPTERCSGRRSSRRPIGEADRGTDADRGADAGLAARSACRRAVRNADRAACRIDSDDGDADRTARVARVARVARRCAR